jgi:hypothetical protein
MVYNRELSKNERAAICALICGIIDNWTDCYLIGAGKTANDLPGKNSLNTTVSRWRNSAKVVKEYERQTAELATRIKGNPLNSGNSENEKRLSEGDNKEHTKNGKRAQIDYTRPENQRTLLNDLINTADDQKDKLDALKTIIQAQKDDKQAAKDNQIQRFYSPLRCSGCPLYQKAKKNLTI